jgi:hypothetical protein
LVTDSTPSSVAAGGGVFIAHLVVDGKSYGSWIWWMGIGGGSATLGREGK